MTYRFPVMKQMTVFKMKLQYISVKVIVLFAIYRNCSLVTINKSFNFKNLLIENLCYS